MAMKSVVRGQFALFCALLQAGSSGLAQVRPGDVTGYSVTGKAITVFADTSRIRFVFYQADIVRVDYLPSLSSILDTSYAVARDTTSPVPVAISSTDSTLVFSAGGVTITCTKSPLRVSFGTGSSQVLRQSAADGFAATGIQRSVSFRMNAADHFYGTGERGTALDKRGEAFDSYNDAFYGYGGVLPRMNINIPFLASTAGYALYFDNTYRGHFDLGSTDPASFSYAASGGELSYFFIAAPTVPLQIERYTWLTGRQPLPPRWALGYLQSKFGYQTQAEAAGIVQTMRDRRIPCDGVILDLYWYAQMGDLSWNTASWPDPHGMMLSFQRRGIKTIVITEPYITSLSINYGEGSAQGFFGKDPFGSTYALGGWWSCNCGAALLDITNPAARAWWWSKHIQALGGDSSGVAGLWTDLGEPERHPDDMRHFLGLTPKIHNMYNALWAKTVYDGFLSQRPDERVFNLTRSGSAGIQRYGVTTWSGDVASTFAGLAVQLPILLGMGVSGLAYHNSDIGGFCCGTSTPELYVRWMQFGTFCPITRAHGTGRGTEPWAYGTTAENIARSFIELRYRLLPYIYTMAHENTTSGMPLARPLFFSSPADPSLASESSAYLWGDNFLVSPVTQAGVTVQAVVLPGGSTWRDYWTGRQYQGGQTVPVQVTLETLPLFVRAGSIIPMQFLVQYTDEHPLDTLMLDIYPAAGVAGSYDLYEDDGRSLAYQSGASATTHFAQKLETSGGSQTFTLEIGMSVGVYAGRPASRTYLAEVHDVAVPPLSVTKGGVGLPSTPSLVSLRQGGDGYFHDPGARVLYVQVRTNPDSAYVIVGTGLQLTSVGEQSTVPAAFALEQNYPNPFNPTTTIRYALPQGAYVTLSVFNILGERVAILQNGVKEAGYHEVRFDATNLPSGVYLCQMQAGDFSQTRKLLHVK
jgi:alpha-glucosidase (family GH31 glycosyl hydrolase)